MVRLGDFGFEGKRIWVAGHTGMVGRALLRQIPPASVVLTAERSELDLTRQADVENWVKFSRPEVVFICAAKVGGIKANYTFPADFIYQNMSIQLNIIESARRFGVRRLIFLGSSCSYPKNAPQPFSTESIMTGLPEETNIWYAVAKISGIKTIEAYRRQYDLSYVSVIPTNCYGPFDNFDPDESHVIPAMIRKFHYAKIQRSEIVEFWGSGRPTREFIYADDLARGLLFLARTYDQNTPVNLGTGEEVSIANLATAIASTVGYRGLITFDQKQPDGATRKVIDSKNLRSMGWLPTTSLESGLRHTYQWCLESGIF